MTGTDRADVLSLWRQFLRRNNHNSTRTKVVLNGPSKACLRVMVLTGTAFAVDRLFLSGEGLVPFLQSLAAPIVAVKVGADQINQEAKRTPAGIGRFF